jgi:hypothetical protein
VGATASEEEEAGVDIFSGGTMTKMASSAHVGMVYHLTGIASGMVYHLMGIATVEMVEMMVAGANASVGMDMTAIMAGTTPLRGEEATDASLGRIVPSLTFLPVEMTMTSMTIEDEDEDEETSIASHYHPQSGTSMTTKRYPNVGAVRMMHGTMAMSPPASGVVGRWA